MLRISSLRACVRRLIGLAGLGGDTGDWRDEPATWRGRRDLNRGRWGGTGGLERLEGRSLLAAISWTGLGGDMTWDHPGNWSTGNVPQVDDDVFIPALPITVAVEVRTNVTVKSVTLHSTAFHVYNLLIQPGGSLYPTEGGSGASTGASIKVLGTLRGTWNLDDEAAPGDPFELVGQIYVEDGGVLDGVTVNAGSVRVYNEGRVRNGLTVTPSSNPLAGGGAISVFGELTVENSMSMTGDLIGENTNDPAEITVGTAAGPQTTLTLFGRVTNAPQAKGMTFHDGGTDSRLINRGVIDDVLGADGWGPITTTIRTDFFENRETVRISETLDCQSDWLNEGVIEIPSTASGFYSAAINLIPALKDGRNQGTIRNESDSGYIQIDVNAFYNEVGALIRGSSSPGADSSISIRANELVTGIENVFLEGDIDPRYSRLSFVDCTLSTSSLENVQFADASPFFAHMTILNAGKILSPEALHQAPGEAPMWEFRLVNVAGGTLSLDADGDDIMIADFYEQQYVSSLTGVTLQGTLDLSHRASNRYANLVIRDGLSGSGRIRVSGQTPTSVHAVGDQVWTGVTVELAGLVEAQSDLVLEPVTAGGSVMLTLDPLVRVEGGRAKIKADAPATNAMLLNSGIVRANVDEALLQIELDSLVIEGALIAENGGFLLDNSGFVQVLSYGQIECRTNSGVTLTGSILQNELAGEIRAVGAGYSPLAIEVDFLRNYGTIESTGEMSGVVVMAIDITNTPDSAIRAKDDGIVTFYTPDWINAGTLEADGGVVHLSYTSSLSNVGTLRSRGGSSLWVDMPQFDNLGTVEADGGLVKIDPAGALAWHNYGTIRSTPAVGSMMMLSGYFNNAGDGQIIADGPVVLEGEFLLGGDALEIVGTGQVTASGAMFQYGSLVLAAGQTLSIAAGAPTIMDSVELTGPGRVRLEGDAVLDYRAFGVFAMNSVFEIGPGASLRTDGPQAWTGGGIVRFAGEAGNQGHLVIGGAQGWTEPSSLQFAAAKIHGAAGRIESGVGIDGYFELASLLSCDAAQGIEIVTDHFFAPTGAIEVTGGGSLLINTIDPWTTFAPVRVASGVFNIYDNADFMGAVTIDAQGTLRIVDGLTRFQTNSLLDTSGDLEVELPASVELRGAAVLRNGRIIGPGALHVHDEMTWLDGDIESQAAVEVHPGAVLTLESAGYRGFDGVLTNNGTVFVKDGTLQGSSMSFVENDGDWKFDVPAGQSASVNIWLFTNNGLVQQANADSQALLTTVKNDGYVLVLAGDLFVTLTGVSYGSFDVRADAAMTIATVAAGNITIDAPQFDVMGAVTFMPGAEAMLVVQNTLYATGEITVAGPGSVEFYLGAFTSESITVSGGWAYFNSIDLQPNSPAAHARQFVFTGGTSAFEGRVRSDTPGPGFYLSGGEHRFAGDVEDTSGDAYVVIYDGTCTIDRNQDWRRLVVGGYGKLTGDAMLGVTEHFDFSGGVMDLAQLTSWTYTRIWPGTISFPPPTLAGHLVAMGTTAWEDCDIRFSSGKLTNNGVLEFYGSRSMLNVSGFNLLHNAGTMIRNGLGTTTIAIAFEFSTSQVYVNGGTLRFDNIWAANPGTLDGYWVIESGATLSTNRTYTTNAGFVSKAGTASFPGLDSLTYNTGSVEFLALAPFAITPIGGTLYNEGAGVLLFDTNVGSIVPFLINNNGLIQLEDNRTLVLPGGTSTGTFDAEYSSVMMMGTQHLTDGARLQGEGLILMGYSTGIGTYSGVTTFSGTTTLAGSLMYVFASDSYESNGMHLSNDSTLIRVTGSLNFQAGFVRGPGTLEFTDSGVMGIFEHEGYPYNLVLRGEPGADNDLDIHIAPGSGIFWTSGTFVSSYVTIDNDGLFEMSAVADLTAYSGAYSVLNNDLGILRQTTAAAMPFTTSLWLNPSEGTAINTSPNGRIEVLLGTLSLPAGTMLGVAEAHEGGTLKLGPQQVGDGALVTGAGRLIIGYAIGTLTGAATTTFSGTSTLAGSLMEIHAHDGYENNGIVLASASSLVRITGSLTLRGGVIRGPGTVEIVSGGRMTILDNEPYHYPLSIHGDPSNDNDLDLRIATGGVLEWFSGSLSNAYLTIDNDGLFEIASDSNLTAYSGAYSVLNNNQGVLRKSGSGQALLWPNVSEGTAINTSSNGRVEILQGAFAIPQGSTGGTISVSSGASLQIGNFHNLIDGARLAGNGLIALGLSSPGLNIWGTVHAEGSNIAIGTASQGAVHLASSASVLLVTGTINWNGGWIYGAGTVRISAGGELHVIPGLSKYMYGVDTSVDNDLDLAIDAGGQFNYSASQMAIYHITVVSDGLISLDSASGFSWDVGGGTVVTNNGVLRKSGAGSFGLTSTPQALSLPGRTEVLGGTLTLPGVQQVSGNTLTGGHWIVSGASTLNLSGATLTTIGAAASVELLGAQSAFPALNGLHTINGSFRLGDGRNFATTGSLTNGGTLLLGSSALAVNGDFTQIAAGVLKLDIKGKLPYQYGHLTATGAANLDGRLEVQTVGYVPRWGDEFRIIDAASRSGVFSQATLDRYRIEYDPDGVTLRCEGPSQTERNLLDDWRPVHP